jgi:hypothetical protein
VEAPVIKSPGAGMIEDIFTKGKRLSFSFGKYGGGFRQIIKIKSQTPSGVFTGLVIMAVP